MSEVTQLGSVWAGIHTQTCLWQEWVHFTTHKDQVASHDLAAEEGSGQKAPIFRHQEMSAQRAVVRWATSSGAAGLPVWPSQALPSFGPLPGPHPHLLLKIQQHWPPPSSLAVSQSCSSEPQRSLVVPRSPWGAGRIPIPKEPPHFICCTHCLKHNTSCNQNILLL